MTIKQASVWQLLWVLRHSCRCSSLGVATTLGMGMGSPDNDGVGSPLSSQEVRATLQREREARKDGNEVDEVDRPLTFEEAAEEQALVDVLRGGIIRAK